MAKGDKKKVQNVADVNKERNQNLITNVREGMVNPTTSLMSEAYGRAVPKAEADYDDIMNQYRGVLSQQSTPVTAERVSYNRSPELQRAMDSYTNFIDTGGFSGQDISDMRARGISPIRAVYGNAMNEMARQKNLSGGYSPNFNAAATRMRSGASQQIADNVQNVNAKLAEMVQQGKQFGTSGLADTSVQDINFGQNAQLANQRAALDAAGINASSNNARLAAVNGMAGLYGTRPGMAGMFGDQVLESTRNAMNLTDQDMANSQAAFNQQMGVASVPSDFQVGAGRVATGIDYAGRVAAGLGGLPGGVKMPLSSRRVNVPGMYGAY